MTLKLLTLDLDNTLWPVDEVIRRAEQISHAWLQEKHPDIAAGSDSAALLELRKTLVRENPDYLHNLTALRKDALTRVFANAGFDTTTARQQAEQAFAVFHEARNQVKLFPDVRPVLEQLANRYQLGALTNGNADLKKIGLDDLFAFHHSAETIGRRKPAPDMFAAALACAGVSADQAVHMGDHPEEDVLAAQQHGFRAIWADLLDTPWPAHLAAPAWRIRHWRELPAVLEQMDE